MPAIPYAGWKPALPFHNPKWLLVRNEDVAIFILVCLSLFFVTPVFGIETIPRFTKSECPFRVEEPLEGVECGYVFVPENREKPEGRSLRLAVVILRSLSSTPEPDPIVFLSGGPGMRSVNNTPARTESPFWKPFREKRDLIFFDQRGTGYSDPEFCPELYSIVSASFRGLSPLERTAFQIRAFQDCRSRMLKQGIDFSAYNSITSAKDLEDIRRALGFNQWNVLGVSYGTRLALTAMRETPHGIRSVILDSPDPPNARIWIDAPAKLERSLQLVFNQCNKDAECAKRFPLLKQNFYSLLKNLETNPIVVSGLDPKRFPDGKLILDGTVFAAGIFRGLYDHRFIPLIPIFIDEIKNRNVELLRAIADALVEAPEESSVGLQYAVDCYEIAPFNQQSEIYAEQKRFPHLREWHEFVNDQELCAAWHDQRSGAIEGQAVQSDIPALVLGGEFDPITPPSYGRLAISTLSNSLFVEVPGIGHVVSPSSDCTRQLLSAFLAHPGKTLDLRCVDKLRKPLRFVTNVRPNAGMYRLLSQLQPSPNPFLVAGIGLVILIFVSVLTWPAAYIMGRRSDSSPISRKARWVAALAAFVALGFFAGVALVIIKLISQNPYVLAFGLPEEFSWLLFFPWLELALLPVVVFLAILAWRQKWWNRTARIHYSLFALACAAFCGIVVWLKFIA